MRVADYIAKFIHDEIGVKHVFGVTGAGIMHLTDGVAQSSLQWVSLHDERSAAMAADAYARAGGTIGVCMVSTGPAATNAITGVAGAWQDSVPMLVISGQVKRSDFRRGGQRQGGVQELEIIPMVKHITKYAVTVLHVDQIRFYLETAVTIARSGRPGPVWLEIPMDIQAMEVPATLYHNHLHAPSLPIPSRAYENVQLLLQQASRPLIIAGQGVRLAGATDLLSRLTARHAIPVAMPYLGIDAIPDTHPCHMGAIGIKGTQYGNRAMQSADLILAIGTSLHSSVTGYDWEAFAPGAKLVVVNVDLDSQRQEVVTRAYCITADAGEFLSELEFPDAPPEWLAQCQAWKREYPVIKESYGETNIYRRIARICEAAEENAIFIADAGSAFYCASQALKLTVGQRYICSGAMATMGFTVPAAIGAHLATGRPVWGITGDGSLQQCLAEVALLEQWPAIRIVVLKNGGYLSIRNSQKNYFGGRLLGESPPCRIPYHPQILVAECDPDQEILPSVQSWVNEDGTMSSGTLEEMKR